MMCLLSPTAIGVIAERSLLRRLEGGCQIPIGAYARLRDTKLELDAVIGSLDGKRLVRRKYHGTAEHAGRVGIELAEELLKHGGEEILNEIRHTL